ncbi:MAG: hypothetical protein K2X39_02040 [Silvanigrellaceae bacterium]|nr:hypothetical protein [Silvanigrellaceae bacterium]
MWRFFPETGKKLWTLTPSPVKQVVGGTATTVAAAGIAQVALWSTEVVDKKLQDWIKESEKPGSEDRLNPCVPFF